MKRYLHNTKVLARTALRCIIVAPLVGLVALGKKAEAAYWAVNDNLPGIEHWEAN